MTKAPGSAELLALEEHCDRAYDRLLALCGTRNGPPRWDDIATLLRERERLLLDRRLAAKPADEGIEPECGWAAKVSMLEAALRDTHASFLHWKGVSERAVEDCRNVALEQQCGDTLYDMTCRSIAGKIAALSTTGEPKR